MNKKTIILTILFAVLLPFIQGCAGKTANPISVYQPNDDQLSCNSILNSMHQIDDNVRKLLPKSNKTGKNVALGVVGAVVFFPALFFMDFSDAEKVEIQAYQRRYDHLMQLSTNKHCSIKRKTK